MALVSDIFNYGNNTFRQKYGTFSKNRAIIGGVDPGKFEPSLKLETECAYADEFATEIKFIDKGLWDKESDGAVSTDNNKIIFDKTEYKCEFYDLPEKQEGGHEFFLNLKKKPLSKDLTFHCITKKVIPHFQPALTTEEKKTANRPANVTGSIAFLYDGYKHNIYGPGKQGHLEAPLFMLPGENRYGEWLINKILSIDGDKITWEFQITIPDDIYNSAIWNNGGLKIDPTFGYTSVGLSTSDQYGYFTFITNATLSEAGTVTSINVYLNLSSDDDMIPVIYNMSTSPTTLNTAGSIYNATAGTGWFSLPISAVLSAAEYAIGHMQHGISFSTSLYFDSNSKKGWIDYMGSWPTPDNPFTSDSTYNNRNYSDYSEYTTEGGGPVKKRVVTIF